MRLILSIFLFAILAEKSFAVTVSNNPSDAATAAAAFNTAQKANQLDIEVRENQYMVNVLNLVTEKFAEGISNLYQTRLQNVVVTPSLPAPGSNGEVSSSGIAMFDDRICQIDVQLSQKILPLHAKASCVTMGQTDKTELEAGSPEFNIRTLSAILRGLRTGQVDPNDFDIRINRP